MTTPLSQDVAREVAPIVEDKVRAVTYEVLELKLKALKSDLRLIILASVALNQFLSHVALPNEVTAPAIVLAIVAPLVKGVLFRG